MCAEHEITEGVDLLIVTNLYLEEPRNFLLKLSKCQVQNVCVLRAFLQLLFYKRLMKTIGLGLCN